jgi:hypothetical protein
MYSIICSIDKQLHELLSSVSFSQYLNPTNITEAYNRFMKGEHTPPFVYKPFVEADDLLGILDSLSPSKAYPFGTLLHKKIELTRLLILALRDRTAEAFDRLAQVQNWYPTHELLSLRFPTKSVRHVPANQSSEQLRLYLQKALHEREEYDWSVVLDSCMSARVLVQSAQKKIFIQQNARFYAHDLPRLVIHEIDVHARRCINGGRQPLRMFQTGLPHALSTEEGLAMIAEQRNNLLSENTLSDQTHLVWAINKAKELGFRPLYEQLKIRVGPRMSWLICLRIKRGLSQPSQPGVYAKDSIYLMGWKRVSHWLEQGGDIDLLYVGGVDIDHPIQEWIDKGWITKQKTPSFWQSSQKKVRPLTAIMPLQEPLGRPHLKLQ